MRRNARSLAFALAAVSTAAHGITGETVAKWHRGSSADKLAAIVFVRTVIDSEINTMGRLAFNAGLVDATYTAYRMFCPPDKYTSSQAAEIVVRYIDARPAQWHLEALNLARAALLDSWPCAKNPPHAIVESLRKQSAAGVDLPASFMLDE